MHVYYIEWPVFQSTTTRPPRDVDPTRLVTILANASRAETLPMLAGHLGMLEPSVDIGYDADTRRAHCDVSAYSPSQLALWLARALVERHDLACSVSRVQHALLARYFPAIAAAWRPSAVS